MDEQVAAPTQLTNPWRATVRTIFAAVVAFSAMWALLVSTVGFDPNLGWVSTSLAVTGAITRLMALPEVDVFIRRFVPWLAPDKPAA